MVVLGEYFLFPVALGSDICNGAHMMVVSSVYIP